MEPKYQKRFGGDWTIIIWQNDWNLWGTGSKVIYVDMSTHIVICNGWLVKFCPCNVLKVLNFQPRKPKFRSCAFLEYPINACEWNIGAWVNVIHPSRLLPLNDDSPTKSPVLCTWSLTTKELMCKSKKRYWLLPGKSIWMFTSHQWPISHTFLFLFHGHFYSKCSEQPG